MLEIYFPGVKLTEYKRVDPARAEAKFRCRLSNSNLLKVFQNMGWTVPGEKSSYERLDGKLNGGYFVMFAKLSEESRLLLKSRDGTFDAESTYEIGFDEISNFECHRVEPAEVTACIRELRFTARFHAEATMSELERYQFATDNATFGLRVRYKREPEQQQLIGAK